MIPTKDWLKASWNASMGLLRPMSNRETGDAPSSALAHPTLVVPIRSLGPTYRERIATHLLALEPQDRYLRFGYCATDQHIRSYVDQLDFERDEIFGVYNRRLELIAMAHLALAQHSGHEQCAEFGVSVLSQGRGQGLGTRLFERATIHARNAGVDMIFIHALTQNRAMLNIVRKAGAIVKGDGADSEAYLALPPATLDSHMTELIGQQWAELDYRLKQQAQQFWRFLAQVQEVRKGVQAASQSSAK